MSNIRLHIARQGERWDNIAHLYYSDPFKVAVILQANPSQQGKESPDPGTRLAIPILKTASTKTTIAPPWDR